jgi:steroid 5-alpha reductase family enzyme
VFIETSAGTNRCVLDYLRSITCPNLQLPVQSVYDHFGKVATKLLGRKGRNLVTKTERNALIALPIVILIALGVALAGSQGGASAAGIPIFALCVGLAFLIQWLAFIPAYLLQTEKFLDLTGSLTYITVAAIAVLLSPVVDGRSILLLALVVIWAARLGIFLFRRIQRTGKDSRFDQIKPSFIRFLSFWTLQGLWVTFTAAAALAAITTTTREELGLFALIGFLVWAFGFVMETVADVQKNRFRAGPKNKGKFIDSGVWAWSRHPNYFGEIVLWIGVAIIALPVLRGWQWATLISPVFVALLLTRISGVPMLEKRADEKWGGQEDYEAYKKRTPVLIPRPRFSSDGK